MVTRAFWLVMGLYLLGGVTLAQGAQMTIAEYRELRAKGQASQQWLQTYILGVGTGIMVTNTHLQLRGLSTVYCPPETLGMRATNYLDIVDRELDTAARLYGEHAQGAVEIALLDGLRRTFPCPAAPQPGKK
jgi:hypothetical protein